MDSWHGRGLDQPEVAQGDLQRLREVWSDDGKESLAISELVLACGYPWWRDEAETSLVDEDPPEAGVESEDNGFLSLGTQSQEDLYRSRSRMRKLEDALTEQAAVEGLAADRAFEGSELEHQGKDGAGEVGIGHLVLGVLR